MKPSVTWIAGLAFGLVCTATQAELVVVANRGLAASSLTREQVASIYLGQSNEYAALDYSDGTPLRALFYAKVTGKELPQVKATWSKLIFTGKAKRPKVVSTAQDVRQALAASDATIGYLHRSDLDDSLKVLLTIP